MNKFGLFHNYALEKSIDTNNMHIYTCINATFFFECIH